MDILQQKKALDLLYDFFVRGKCQVERIPYTPSKTCLPPPAENFFPRCTPEEKGIPSATLAALLEDLEHSSRVCLHSLTILCDGAVICEASAPPYDRRIPHQTHSMCKTLTGMAIGLLWDAGKISLDVPAYRYFPASALPGRMGLRMKAVTVRHLLTMTSSVSFGETGAATETDWVRAFFSADVKAKPGEEFAYNSMNTYILAAIVRAVTGEGLVDYLRPRLLEPLGIHDLLWETCPRGTEKGGWGLYIAQEDMAKLGQLLLDGGRFGEQRILSEAWVTMATSCQAGTPTSAGAYDYAFQMWCARDGSSFLYNGMLGQNVWVCPQNRIVVVTNAGNTEFFQKSTMLSLIQTHLGPSLHRAPAALPPQRSGTAHLREAQAHFFASRAWIPPMPPLGRWQRLWRRLRRRSLQPLPALCDKLAGRRVPLPESNTGILPVFTRLMQNNHTSGLRAISFAREGEHFYVTFDEGTGAVYRLEAGFYEYLPATLTVKGEMFRVALRAGFAVDEDGRRLLKLDMAFPELSHTRRIKIFFDDESVRVCLREMPGREIVDSLLRTLPVSAPKTRGLVSFLTNRINLDYLLMKVYEKFEPELLSRAEEAEPLPPLNGEDDMPLFLPPQDALP